MVVVWVYLAECADRMQNFLAARAETGHQQLRVSVMLILPKNTVQSPGESPGEFGEQETNESARLIVSLCGLRRPRPHPGR